MPNLQKFINKNQLLIVLALGLITFYFLSEIILVFLLSAAIANLFYPLSIKLHKLVRSRALSVILIMTLLILLLVGLILAFVPIIYYDIFSLTKLIQKYKISFSNDLIKQFEKALNEFIPSLNPIFQQIINSMYSLISTVIQELASKIIYSGMFFVNFIGYFAVTVLITYYMLYDWQKITNYCRQVLSSKQEEQFKAWYDDIKRKLGTYLKGQGMLCLIMMIYYSVGFYLIDLSGALFLGIVGGALIFIPYIGFLITFFTLLVFGLAEFNSFDSMIMLGLVLALGNILENMMAYKFIGDKVGLHPLTMIFGILSGGYLFGIIGIIFSIPLTILAKSTITTAIKFDKIMVNKG